MTEEKKTTIEKEVSPKGVSTEKKKEEGKEVKKEVVKKEAKKEVEKKEVAVARGVGMRVFFKNQTLTPHPEPVEGCVAE